MSVGADSLLNMARRATGRYSAGITDIGDIPYELIKPALLKIESPEKLVSSTPTLVWNEDANSSNSTKSSNSLLKS